VARDGASDIDNARAGITRIEALLASTGAPLDLAAIGIQPAHFDQIARASITATRLVLNNPAPLTVASVTALLERGVAADRSWWVI
jgi:alcohol dehydrogenase class IV